LLNDEEMAIAGLWNQYRGSGMGGGPLPFGGGAADQPALVMDAFAAMSGAAAALERDR
jgi:hypothetical protein